MKLALPGALRDAMEEAARAAFPNECCGLIEGLWEGGIARVLAVHPARNIATARDRFEIDPADHFAALRTARANRRAIIGCYHSHPGGAARPSAMDQAGAMEDGFLWLIAALEHADAPVAFAAFLYSAACFVPVDFLSPVGADLVTSSL